MVFRLKQISVFVVLAVVSVVLACSGEGKKGRVKIEESRSYEASLFRQNCMICHGPEAEGKEVSGKKTANLRQSSKSEEEMYLQIANGGNGMLPFSKQLSEKDMRLLAKFIKRDLQGD